MNITDAIIPYFEGKASLDKATSNAFELFLKTFEAETFVCQGCGEIVFPKVKTYEYGIFIESKRADVRGGKGNHLINRNICEDCIRKMRMKG